MICYNCGKKLEADDKFCSDCGVENLVTEEELAIDNEISKKSKKVKKPLANPKKTAIVAIVLAGVALYAPLVVGFVLSVIALVNATRVLKETDERAPKILAKIAKILSIVAIVWSCVATAIAVLAVILWCVSTIVTVIGSVLMLILSFLFTDLGDVLGEFLSEFASML